MLSITSVADLSHLNVTPPHHWPLIRATYPSLALLLSHVYPWHCFLAVCVLGNQTLSRPETTVPPRFDSELSQAHEEAQREKLQREKLQREKDMLLAEAFSLKQQMEVCGSPFPWCPVFPTGWGQLHTSLIFLTPGKRHGHCRVHPEGCLPGS